MSNRAPYRRTRRGTCAAAWALALFLGLSSTAAAARPSPVATPPAAPAPPGNRNDLQGWLDYQRHLGSPSLPAAAHMFYRRGVEMLRAGADEDGVRMLRGACELDPTALAPRVALLGHFGLRDVSQSLMELARIADLARTHFPLQHYFAIRFTFAAALALFLGTLLCALYVVWRRRELVRHGYEEFLGRFLSPRMARAGAWGLVALPFLAGIGLALPAAFTLTAAWPGLRRSERALTLALVALLIAIPLGFASLGHLATPDHPSRPPFYGSVDLSQAPYSESRLAELQALTARHPQNAFLHYATAWMAYRGGHLDLARAEFEVTAALWPSEPRVPNNLGNLAELAGRHDEAERLYREAASLEPDWAMPHYNLGQLYTRQFRYAEASEELARATSFDFDMVRALQADAQVHAGDPLPLAWGWLAPHTFWEALLAARPQGPPRVPPGWDRWLELRSQAVAVLAVVLVLLGAALGALLRARLPVRQCSNCDQALCRRCATRRRDQAFCSDCSAAQREASTPEFARLLLARRRRQLRLRSARWNLAVAALIPGAGPLLLNRLGAAWFLLCLAFAGLQLFLGISGPFPYEARVGPLGPLRVHLGGIVLVMAVHLASLAYYLMARGSEDRTEIQDEPARKPPMRLARAA